MRKFLILMDKTKQKQFSHSSTFQYSRNLQHPNLPVITIFKNVNDDASINNVHVDFFLCILPTLLKLAYLYIFKYIYIRYIKMKIFLSRWVCSRDLTTCKCYHIIIKWKMKCESWKAMKCVSENNSHPKFSEFYDHHNRLHCIVLTREDSFIMMWDEWWA